MKKTSASQNRLDVKIVGALATYYSRLRAHSAPTKSGKMWNMHFPVQSYLRSRPDEAMLPVFMSLKEHGYRVLALVIGMPDARIPAT